MTGGGTDHYYHADALSSVVALSAASGNLAETYRYTIDTGWGQVDEIGRVLPAAGPATARDYTDQEKDAIARGCEALGMDMADYLRLVGDHTCDARVNDDTVITNIPAKVWDFRIGGLPVVQRWLAFRDQAVRGRDMTVDEANRFRPMVYTIVEMLLLGPTLDANYAAVKADPYGMR